MKIVRALLLILLTLLLVPSLILVGIFLFPDKLITKSSVETVAREYLPELKVDWKSLNFDIDSKSLTTKEVKVSSSESTCIEYEKSFKFCANELSVEILIDVPDFSSLIVKTLVVDEGSLFLWSAPEKPSGPPNLAGTVETIVGIADMVSDQVIHNVDVAIPTIRLYEGDTHSLASLELTNQDPVDHLTGKFQMKGDSPVELSLLIKEKDRKAQGAWEAELVFGKGERATRLQLMGDKFLGEDESIGVTLLSQFDSPESPLLGKAIRITAFFDLRIIDESDATFNIQSLRLEQIPSASFVELKQCELRWLLGEGYFEVDSSLNCERVALELDSANRPSEIHPQLPDRLNFALQAEATDKDILEYSINLKPIENKLLTLEAAHKGRLNFQKELSYKLLDLNTQLVIKKFADLARAMEKQYDFTLPAPFSQIDGTLKAQSHIETLKDVRGNRLPLKVSSNLKGKNTELRLSADGAVTFYDSEKKNTQVKGEVIIEDVVFTLPKLDPLYGIPKFTSDARIQKEISPRRVEDEVSDSGIDLDLKIKTRSSSGIKLYYYLVDPYLPVSLDIHLVDGSSPAGEISLGEFKISYLEKSLRVTDFTIRLEPEVENSEIKLSAEAVRGAYEVGLSIFGSFESPQIQLSSQPELSRQEILALLLYNRAPQTLTSKEQTNAAEVDAAISDHAIGLLGMWAFASAPIDTVTYDPEQEVYTAQVSLPSGTTLNVGSDWENVTGVELAKKIGMNWFLVSRYRTNTDGEEEGRMMLEWRQAY